MTAETRPASGIDFRKMAVVYEARVAALLGSPLAQRAAIQNPTHLAIYDRIHQDNPLKDPSVILDQIEGLDSIDGPLPYLTIPDRHTGFYLQGVRDALWSSLERDPDDGTKRLPENVGASRIREQLALARSRKMLVDAGYPDEIDSDKENDFDPSYLNGVIAGSEWVLGIRPDLGIDVQAEIDRFEDHPLRTRPDQKRGDPDSWRKRTGTFEVVGRINQARAEVEASMRERRFSRSTFSSYRP